MTLYESDTFRLVIRLGNDHMNCNADIADGLHVVIGQLLRGQIGGVVMDVNGNGVGTWAVETPARDDHLKQIEKEKEEDEQTESK